jgi:hypothetical protein
VLTSIVRKSYTTDGAELLHQPALVNFFSKKLEAMSNRRLADDDLVIRIRKMLTSIRPLIGEEEGAPIPAENVKKINQLTRDIVVSITSQET